jgi:flagellar protein FliL
MAEADTDVNEAEDGTEAAEAPRRRGGILGKLVIAAVAAVLIGVGAFVGPLVVKMISGGPDEAVAEAPKQEASAKPAQGPELYQSLLPPLVVNIKDADGEVHYMQMSMEAMARDQDVVNAIRDHTTVIRNNLILLYGSAMYEDVITREGKEKLLKDGLAEIQSIMQPHIGNGKVEALYFTGLIIQ